RGVGRRGENRVELLGPDDVAVLALEKVFVHMRREIGNQQHRIASRVADVDRHARSVGLADTADQRERTVDPLVVLQLTVSRRIEELDVEALAERLRLEL